MIHVDLQEVVLAPLALPAGWGAGTEASTVCCCLVAVCCYVCSCWACDLLPITTGLHIALQARSVVGLVVSGDLHGPVGDSPLQARLTAQNVKNMRQEFRSMGCPCCSELYWWWLLSPRGVSQAGG
jgi:hypothetical protein